MKNFMGILGALLIIALITGCAAGPEYNRRQSFITFRAQVGEDITPTHSWKPYAITLHSTLKNNGWGPGAEQYRIAYTAGLSFKDDMTGFGLALVPDQIPVLHKMDIVDVWFPDRSDVNLSKLWNAPIIVRLVCRIEDKACIHAAVKQAHWFSGVVNRRKPDLSKLTFSKYYDKQGHLLPHPIDPYPGAALQEAPVPANLPVVPDQLEK